MRQSPLVAVALVGLVAARLAAAAAPPPVATLSAAPAQTINWPAFLAQSDMVWPQLPNAADDAPFLGNGRIGAVVRLEGNGSLSWDVNRTDVTNQGQRLAMGRVVLQSGEAALGGTARLDLWNAEVRGTLTTPKGQLRWRSFALSAPSVLVIELAGIPAGREFDVLWWPVLAHLPRRPDQRGPYDPADLNPPPRVTSGVGVVSSVQTFTGHGAFAVVLRRIFAAPTRRIYVVAIGRGDSDTAALAEATSEVEQANSQGFDRLLAGHRSWWNQYYPESFVSLPDARLQAYYWIQMYRLASAMRPDGPIPGLQGPWFRNLPLDVIDWDLNVPLTYSPLFTANRLALAESLFGALDRRRQNLINNVPAALRANAAAIGHASDQNLISPVDLVGATSDQQREMGNLPWAAFLFWKYSRYRMDDAVLRDRVLPLLGRATAYYLAELQLGPDGRYHLPPTLSPQLGSVPDADFDLALLRWSLQTLVDSAQRLHLNEPRLTEWRHVLSTLAPLPTNGGGLLVGRGRPLRESQPRASHLMAIAPLHQYRPDRPNERHVIEQSVHTWESRTEAFHGYSFATAAGLDAYLGEGDRAAAELQVVLNRFARPNTADPDPATALSGPLAAASSIQDLLLQSWGGRLHVFPAMPTGWKNAAFATLRGEGAFLVSAVWANGAAAWVRLDSEAGGNCHFEVPGWTTAVVRAASSPAIVVSAGKAPGEWVVGLPRGAWAVLAPTADAALPPLAPVPALAGAANPYPSNPHS